MSSQWWFEKLQNLQTFLVNDHTTGTRLVALCVIRGFFAFFFRVFQYCQLDSIAKKIVFLTDSLSLVRRDFLDDPTSRVFYRTFAPH